MRNAEAATVADFASRARAETVEAGATLVLEGDAVGDVLVLASGFARSYRFDARRGREFTLGVHGMPYAFGLVAAFLVPPRFTTGVEMMERGVVLRLEATAILEAVSRDAGLATTLLRDVAARHARLTERVDELLFLDLDARLSRLLLEHAGDTGWLLPSNSALAARLGTVPELVSRKLGEFYRRGWVRLERRRVWVVDRGALEARR